MFKHLRTFCHENIYIFIGLLVGLYISTFLSDTFDVQCKRSTVPHWARNDTAQEINGPTVVSHKLSHKIIDTKKGSDNNKKPKLIRPRYYSTELGIREKLFVGIFTSEERVNTRALHVNRTIGHLVNKIKFFITAQYKLKTKFNLTGLVGFTDARDKYRPFQVIKYVGDSFAQDYDYYFFANDYTFTNIRQLRDVISKISVGMDVYLGTKVADSSYCNLDAGILVSNSVLKAMRLRLEWCIMNAVSDDYSENIGRCVYHSIGLSCQESVQGMRIPSLKIKHFEIDKHIDDLSKRNDFNKAITIYPILEKNDLHLLNAYFLKQRLTKLKTETDELAESLPKDIWPPGHRTGAKPSTRFDLPREYYFNMTHMFFPDDFTNIRTHTEPELLDILNIIEEIKATVATNYSNSLQYKSLINGYRIFDLSRGMDYKLDLSFIDKTTGEIMTKRFEVCKPLGNVEFISVPYVTENTRVTIIMPVQENEVALALDFLKNYMSSVLERKEKTFLMLVLIYQFNSESRGVADVFNEIKNVAVNTNSKYKNEDTKMAWLSIRLPESESPIYLENTKALNFAVIDLALKKIGLDSLVLVLDVYAQITVDFLNRVRMNTISNFQIFSPIPFRQYSPEISQAKTFDVNKNTGHFDKEHYKYIAFYGKDYVYARKRYTHKLPIVRVDNDINLLLKDEYKNIGNVFEMFLIHFNDLHCMRATEMNLKVKYHKENEKERQNLFFGNNAQLAKLLLTKEDQIKELNLS